jgi:hypothetical protein
LGKYKNIIILQQKKESGQRPLGKMPFPGHRFSKDGKAPMGPPMGQPMERPIPKNFKPIFSSPYFSAFQLERE